LTSYFVMNFIIFRPDDLLIKYLAHLPSGGSMGPIDLSPTNNEGLSQSISNAPLPTPLGKCKEGLKLFDDIINRLDDTSQKDKLVKSLNNFAKTDTK